MREFEDSLRTTFSVIPTACSQHGVSKKEEGSDECEDIENCVLSWESDENMIQSCPLHNKKYNFRSYKVYARNYTMSQ